ncbi:hypothetical protein HK104_011275 [Borealophlyctis nickersoniae]|nr:hypothetical protein HK104_011275 [Borealophlyctis nickersoniae]
MFKTRPAIAGQSCFNCNRNPEATGNRLATCTACRRVRYCDAACQVADWQTHRTLCSAIARSRKAMKKDRKDHPVYYIEEESDSPMTKDEYIKQLEEDLQLLQQTLRRPLTENERRLFTLRPKCNVCFRRGDKLKPCSECRVIFYCRAHSAHLQSHQERYCGIYRNLNETESLVFAMNEAAANEEALDRLFPLWIPTGFPIPPHSIPTTWTDYFSLRPPPQPRKSHHADAVRRRYTSTLTQPLTIVWALSHFSILTRAKHSLTIHVVGAGAWESAAEPLYEEILHFAPPTLTSLRVLFIGPECVPTAPKGFLPLCDACTAPSNPRSMVLEHYGTPYHTFTSLHPTEHPDLIVSFNSGIHEPGEESQSWKPTLELISTSSIRCPWVFTSYNERESRADAARLLEMGAEVCVGPSENPLGSQEVLVDAWDVDGLYAANMWLVCVEGRE